MTMWLLCSAVGALVFVLVKVRARQHQEQLAWTRAYNMCHEWQEQHAFPDSAIPVTVVHRMLVDAQRHALGLKAFDWTRVTPIWHKPLR